MVYIHTVVYFIHSYILHVSYLLICEYPDRWIYKIAPGFLCRTGITHLKNDQNIFERSLIWQIFFFQDRRYSEPVY